MRVPPTTDPGEPRSSNDEHNCPACDYVWYRYGEPACHAHSHVDAHYLAQLIDESGTELEATTEYAMSSGIHAGEAFVRDLARRQEVYFHGAPPQREDDVYTRRWTSNLGQSIIVKVSRTR